MAAVSDPPAARAAVEPLLADSVGEVRAAACEAFGRIGDGTAPEALTRATSDDAASVRHAAVSALGAYDDPGSLPVLLAALDDPDRDVALRAGESLVRLARLPVAGTEARAVMTETDAWPLETARVLDSLGAV
jgi:HEAT repeat protein